MHITQKNRLFGIWMSAIGYCQKKPQQFTKYKDSYEPKSSVLIETAFSQVFREKSC